MKRHKFFMKVFVRTGHTLLILAVVGSLMWHETDLSRAVNHADMSFCIPFFSLLLFSLFSYYTACVINPGFVHIPINFDYINEVDDGMNESDLMLTGPDGTEEQPVKLRKCGFCGIQQPLRARHCEECGSCVRKYDHHCPWLETCVGEGNHCYFWIFLGSTAVLILWGLYIIWPSFIYSPLWKEWLKLNAVLLIDTIIMIFGICMVGGLFSCHTYVMCTGLTTWELMSRERITYLRNLEFDINPFHEGYICNTVSFLCRPNKRKWDLIYHRTMSRYFDKTNHV